ncbi:alpha/beta fold hydrolase [Nostoc sp.]|uniref:alpha/beta fold hydrolase n=1 Tax=Nostoc sp. TaxID=1180 RepID=UPI002FF7EF29
MLLTKKNVQGFLIILALAISGVVGLSMRHPEPVVAQPLAQTAIAKPSIVLVHGTFADATSWQHVIPLLECDGYTVTAVQNALTSLPDDVATTKRVIDAQKGTVVVVGHSYGGSVITGAAASNPQVKALVYIAAYAPEAGEKISALNAKYAASPIGSALVPDTAGFLYINREKFHDVFAKDVSTVEARVMAATQKPVNSVAFDQAVNNVAWKTIPSWYLVSQEDQVINPELERFMAKRIGAKTTEIKASHVSFISHPNEVVKLIEAAATAPVK